MALGEILKQKRQACNFTQEYIAERTNLMISTIEALETDNFNKIAGVAQGCPLYGKNFISLYCKVLGINPQPLIDEFCNTVGQGKMRLNPKANESRRVLRPVAAPVHTGQHTVLPPKDPRHPEPASLPRLVTAGQSSLRPATPLPQPPPPKPLYATIPVVIPPTDAPASQPVPPAPAPFPPASAAPATSEPPAEPTETFTLEGDTLPPESTQRPAFGLASEAPKERRYVTVREARAAQAQAKQPSPLTDENDLSQNTIFAPHRPAETPTSPIIKLFQVLGATLKDLCINLKNRLSAIKTKPKIRRIRADEAGPLLSRQTITHILTVFAVLIAITLIFFLFRWVFNESSDLADPTIEAVKDLPILTPPEPYFS
jgi:hypothetical protein